MTYELSYGECAAIADEWEAYKKKNGIAGIGSAMLAMAFIVQECAGVYDTDEEQDAVFEYIGCLERE